MSSIDMSPGVLGVSQVERLFKEEKIASRSGLAKMPGLDGSAFDLPLGMNAWRLEYGQRPTTRELQKLKDKSSPLGLNDDETGKHFYFKKGEIYLVELDYRLQLPSNINGRATGKSSVGRLDVITRLLTERCQEYDIVDAGYEGSLHLLVLPQTFSIKVSPGMSLNQLRLFSGPPYGSIITKYMIREYGTPFWHVPRSTPEPGNRYESWEEVVKAYNASQTADPTLFDLKVELADPGFSYIFKAKCVTEDCIDIRKKDGSYDPMQYFEQVHIEAAASHSVVLEHNSFYIMKSKERLHIPQDVAVEVVAISERIGDIRIHYAGFAHPGFGRHGDLNKPGTPLIFEVRATDMATRLYDGSLLARVQLYRMSGQTASSSSPYDKQELKLSKVFSGWPGSAS